MILPADLNPRAFLGADSLSYSELNTLSKCENSWALSYTGEREKSAPGKAMQLGTAIHAAWGAWWTGNVATSENELANLLMSRYERFYGADRHNGTIKMLAVEMPIAARLPGGPWFFGFIDGLAQVTGMSPYPNGLYVAELKSMDNLGDMMFLVESTQTPLYVDALRKMGYPVLGSFIDGIRTSGAAPKIETQSAAYKRFRDVGCSTADAKELAADPEQRLTLGEPPLAESFARRFLLGENLDIPRALRQAARATKTRRELLAGEEPMRNIGKSCSWCFNVAQCFDLEVEVLPEEPSDF